MPRTSLFIASLIFFCIFQNSSRLQSILSIIMDARHWDVNELKSYLYDVGLDPGEVEGMTEQALRELVISLTGDDQIPMIDTQDDFNHTSIAETPVLTFPVPSQNSDSMHLDDELTHDQILQQFLDVTGAETDAATQLLEACAWNIDTAISMHMEQEDAQQSRPSQSQSLPSQSSQFTQSSQSQSTQYTQRMPSSSNDPFIRPFNRPSILRPALQEGLPQEFQDAMDAHRRGMMQQQQRVAMHYGGGYDDDDMEIPANNSPLYDENGVRRPDPVRVSRLLGDGGMSNDFSRADDPSVEWLFPPPRHISFPGTFLETKTLAKQEKKWILVNIQSHQEFASHQLNRDTWSDETVQEILRENFIFWQRGHTSQDARNYMALYHIQESDLPHIGIIDPRTGSKTSTIKGYMEPRVMTQTLFEFFDENSFDSQRAGTVRHRTAGQAASSSSTAAGPIIIDDDDDGDEEALTAAGDVKETTRGAVASSRCEDKDKEEVREAKKPRDDQTAVAPLKIDYGAIPDEPPISPEDANVVKVMLKLANGKGLVRRYHRSDRIRVLFAVAQQAVPDAAEGKPFEISTTYPKSSLSDKLDSTLGEVGLAGSQVAMTWT